MKKVYLLIMIVTFYCTLNCFDYDSYWLKKYIKFEEYKGRIVSDFEDEDAKELFIGNRVFGYGSYLRKYFPELFDIKVKYDICNLDFAIITDYIDWDPGIYSKVIPAVSLELFSDVTPILKHNMIIFKGARENIEDFLNSKIFNISFSEDEPTFWLNYHVTGLGSVPTIDIFLYSDSMSYKYRLSERWKTALLNYYNEDDVENDHLTNDFPIPMGDHPVFDFDASEEDTKNWMLIIRQDYPELLELKDKFNMSDYDFAFAAHYYDLEPWSIMFKEGKNYGVIPIVLKIFDDFKSKIDQKMIKDWFVEITYDTIHEELIFNFLNKDVNLTYIIDLNKFEFVLKK